MDTNTPPVSRFAPPLQGAANPGRTAATTPGSFALAPDIGGPLAFASPDTPGMPAPSDKTAWDFIPDGWLVEILGPRLDASMPHASVPLRSAAGRAAGHGAADLVNTGAFVPI